MNDVHEPTPEFLAHMERETLYALRRPAPQGRGPLLQHLRTAALVVLALGVGAGCVVVAERVQDSRRVERELARNGVQVELAERRFEALKARTETARLRHAEGVVSMSEITEAERRLLGAERALRHVRLEREELDAGGSTFPRTTVPDGELELDLTAPPVAGRDFVSEHLRIDHEACAADLEHARAELERATVLHDAGRVPESVPGDARAAVETLERRLASLDQRLAARAEFLAGKTSREQCELADLQRSTEARRADAKALVRRLRDDLARAEQLHSAGVAPAPDELRLDLDQAECELELMALELEALRQR
ncbi:MAG: hypothetical protein NTV21_11815 [Planctomycetota bacterium]|nr:hypothetical protein [Planctomycetota bacterium]